MHSLYTFIYVLGLACRIFTDTLSFECTVMLSLCVHKLETQGDIKYITLAHHEWWPCYLMLANLNRLCVAIMTDSLHIQRPVLKKPSPFTRWERFDPLLHTIDYIIHAHTEPPSGTCKRWNVCESLLATFHAYTRMQTSSTAWKFSLKGTFSCPIM